MKKRGEMTSDKLVNLILLVAAFVILLLLIGGFAYWWYTTVDELTCEQSVDNRASFNTGIINTNEIVPLNCDTTKICLTGGGECDQLKVSEDDRIEKEGVKKIEAKKIVLDTFADGLQKCHSNLGEGKKNFMPSKTWEQNYCLICSRIAFDQEAVSILQEEGVNDITYNELYQHLGNKYDPDGNSYLSYIYPGWENPDVAAVLFENMRTSTNNIELKNLDLSDWKIDLGYEDGYAIIAQMKKPGKLGQYVATSAVVGVVVGASIAAVFTGGLSLTSIPAAIGIASAGLGGSTVLGGVTFVLTDPNGEYFYSSPMVYPYDLTSLKNLECTSFETAP